MSDKYEDYFSGVNNFLNEDDDPEEEGCPDEENAEEYDRPSDSELKKMLEHGQRTAQDLIEWYELPPDKARMIQRHEEYLMGDMLADNAETMRELF